MAGELQPLSNNFKIVDENGLPTLYFIQWAQQRQIDITAGITAAQALQIATDYVADWAAGRSVFAGAGLDGGGNLSADITIDANASAILDLISNVQGTVLFRGAANWEGLAPGTAGYVFSTNGPAADPTWIAMSGGGGGGGGALVFLEEQVASGSAELDFTASISATYDEYVIEFIGLIPSAGTPSLLLQLSTDGGATYNTANYSYAHVIYGLSTNFGQYIQGTTTGALLMSSTHTTATQGVDGTAKLFDPLGTSRYKRLNSDMTGMAGDGNTYGGFARNIWSDTTAANAFRILFATGNITSGVVRCYGVAKTPPSPSGGGSIQDLLDMAVAAAADASFTVNHAIDAMVTQGDMVALAFYAYCPGSGAVQTSANQITVPPGKTAVLVRVEQNIQSQVNPSFYAARLWNVTTASQVFNTAYGADTIPAGYSGSLQPDTANSSISYPRVIGVAGDVIEAHHWTANDGNSRTVTAQYYVAFV